MNMSKIKFGSVKNAPENKIVLYTDKSGNVELRADVQKDTLWATQIQVSSIFDCSIDNVSLHLKNIFKDKELKENSVTEESSITAQDGKRYNVKFYNLDAIIAVGYRVNSKKATKFRIWATKILRQYLVKGFNLDERKLVMSTEKLDDLHKVIEFIESKSKGGPLKAKLSLRLTKDVMK
jgi:hypothetical protein